MNTSFARRLSLMLLAACMAASSARSAAPSFRCRWLYVDTNLQVADNETQLEALMLRAKNAGYNGVVLNDFKLGFLDSVPSWYNDNAKKLVAAAKAMGMGIFPCVCPIGYSQSLLTHDPNLAEGLPIRDDAFTVHAGVAAPSSTDFLPNGAFEAATGDHLSGWTMQDFPGGDTFVDAVVKHGGAQSLRMEHIGTADPQYGHARIMQEVPLTPFHQYHLSVWVKTKDFETTNAVQGIALDPNGNTLSFATWRLQATQDWTQYHFVFNSLANTMASVYLGVWGGKGGTIWWDDARLEDAGLLNVLRRGGCPLTVKGDDGTVYQEGVDFDAVKDDRLGNVPWPGEYEVYHTPPAIHIMPGSHIKDGQTLHVSFYDTVVTGDDQVACCLTEPKVYDLLQDQIKRVNDLFHPAGFFMVHDELRVANWCAACANRHLTAGQLLADNVQRCTAMIRGVAPKAPIYVWSDMFDPYHNAHDHYYLDNGTLTNSWAGLDKSVGVANWNFESRDKSLPWFSKLGNHQVLAGYYDTTPDQIQQWLTSAKGVANVDGVMYTTWANRYDDLEAFAKAAGFYPKGSPTATGPTSDSGK